MSAAPTPSDLRAARAEPPLVYLASPYSHSSSAVRRARAEQADLAAVHLIRQGYAVFSPLSHGQRLVESGPGTLPLDAEAWRAVNERVLESADALFILALPGWERSAGVAAELALARRRGIPVTLMIPGDLPPGTEYHLCPAPMATEAGSGEPDTRRSASARTTGGKVMLLHAIQNLIVELLKLYAAEEKAA